MVSDYLKHLTTLLLAGTLASFVLLPPRPVKAQTPNFAELSISDLGTVMRDGSFGDISWRAGTPASEILQLGTFSDTKLPQMSMGYILKEIGLSPEQVSLEAASFLKKLSLKDFVDTIPSLGSTRLKQVAPFKALIKQQFGTDVSENLSNRTLSQLSQNANFSSLTLEELPTLNNYSLTSIPGLSELPIDKFTDWESLPISNIPGLDQLPFKTYLSDLIDVNLPLAMADVVFSDEEANRTNTITGSYNEGFQVPCNQSNCAHLELGDLPGWPKLMQGKQWISGDSQWVSGGSGCLTGKEPTGRHPFSKSFKVVLNETDEAAGQAQFSLYFRFAIFCGTSPYIIGPFPFYSVKEKDTVIVGF
ncbi:hypothetical protein [Chroococcus sp. FPU101]|uniref:hypothetical protein n=1 Tax=Chroococcus sp. FPU101 TaxID=1974212 RepID=UPI001A8DA01B|nr:hypothetical protein [Chroococcus sp. FPU101]GFE72067.1 hypothetical protein CFPU101_46770 [Chroococcus sp. FPU101]